MKEYLIHNHCCIFARWNILESVSFVLFSPLNIVSTVVWSFRNSHKKRQFPDGVEGSLMRFETNKK